MEYFNYYYTETWSGSFTLAAHSKEEADEFVKNYDIFDPEVGLVDSMGFDKGEAKLTARWTDEDETNHTLIGKEKPIQINRSGVDRLFAHPKSKEPIFSHEEIAMISNALIRSIQDASKASELIDSAEAFRIIERHILALQNLNLKVNVLDESE